MFEEAITPVPASSPTGARVLAPEGEPIEFIYNGRKFHIHAIVSRWRESGGWWNRISDGKNRVTESTIFDDGARAIWRVEAAPEGALTTFEIELDEALKGVPKQVKPTFPIANAVRRATGGAILGLVNNIATNLNFDQGEVVGDGEEYMMKNSSSKHDDFGYEN